MPSALGRAVDSFLDLFRPRPVVIPPDLEKLPELIPSDYESRRETYPLYPLLGAWTPDRIIHMLEQHDIGNFQASELFYHALRKEGLIASALDMRKAASQEFSWTLSCPKEAPDEMHIFTEALAKDWQSVMSDDVRGEIVERVNVFGFQVCRIQWTWNNGQKEPRLIPYTHSSLSYRQDLWCYQGISERGLEIISSDGREWVVFSLGGTRPWLKGLIRPLAFVYFGIITGDDMWLNFNDKFAEPIKKRVIPRMMREQAEPLRLYAKESAMRGGDMVLCPQDQDTGRGYDFEYVQVDAKGFETLKEQLARFDERAAIIILGHNLLQSVKGGSLAAMKAALRLLRMRAIMDLKVLMAGFEPVSKVWARANFGENPDDFPELNGRTPETVSWSLCYDLTDPEEKQAAAVMAAQFSQAFSGIAKSLEKASPDAHAEFWGGVDIREAAEKCGIPWKEGEVHYEQEEEATELAGETLIAPPAHVQAAARRSLTWVQKFSRGATQETRALARRIVRGRVTERDLATMAAYFAKHEAGGTDWDNLKRPTAPRIAWGLMGDMGDGRGRKWVEQQTARLKTLADPAPLMLASGDTPDSAAGLIEGQAQIDRMADENWAAPGLASILAALAAASDWADLKQRLTGIVREHDLTAYEGALEDRLHQAAHIGRESVDHDLPTSMRAEVDAADRKLSQKDKLAEVRGSQQRQSTLAKVAAGGMLFAIAKSLWEGADRAAAQGQPLEMSKAELAEAMRQTWGDNGTRWDAARAEPLQHAFTYGRVHRLNDASLLAVFPYWRLDAVLDSRTTPLCRGLNGYTRPAGDPAFPIPPLHYHCRSTVRGITRAEGEASVSTPVSAGTEAGFGALDSYPEPVSGPEPLLVAYRARAA